MSLTSCGQKYSDLIIQEDLEQLLHAVGYENARVNEWSIYKLYFFGVHKLLDKKSGVYAITYRGPKKKARYRYYHVGASTSLYTRFVRHKTALARLLTRDNECLFAWCEVPHALSVEAKIHDYIEKTYANK